MSALNSTTLDERAKNNNTQMLQLCVIILGGIHLYEICVCW